MGLAIARVVGQPPVLGYLVAGLIIGPYTLPTPLITNLDTIGLLAELGLVLLLFGIGLELGWRRIRNIGFPVLVIGVVEISVMTLFGVWIASMLPGMDGSHGLYLGGALAISSSAILLKGLRDGGNLTATWGRTIVGILLVEDFAAVILLTVLAGLATTGSASVADASWLVAKLGIFCIAVLVLGTLAGSRLMDYLSRTQSDETLLLASLGLCFLMALGATALGLSAAAGAFLVGVVIGDTRASERVTHLVSPVRDLFGALFFLSIGMLIDYRSLGEYIIPALAVVGVFMIGKIAANTVGSILAGQSPSDAARVSMTMPQMGEFSLAIGRLSPTDALGVSPLSPILTIATAVTSVLAPLTARSSAPVCQWIDRRSPAILRRIVLAIRLGVDTFWSAFSLTGETGIQLRNAGRTILINTCIIVVIAATATTALFAFPALLGDLLNVSRSLVGLIMVGTVMGLSTPSVIAIWRALERLSHLSTIFPETEGYDESGLRIRYALRLMVRNGLAAVFLVLLFLLSLPLIIRMLALGSLTTPLSVLLLVAPMIAVGIFSFRVHRVLEPAFTETFVEESEAEPWDAGEDYLLSAAANSVHDEADPLVINVIGRLNEQGEILQLLEGKVAGPEAAGDVTLEDEPATRDAEE